MSRSMRPTSVARTRQGRKGRSKANKTIVFAMLDRETGEVISKVVPNASNSTLHPEIERHVTKGSTSTPTNSHLRCVAKLGYGRGRQPRHKEYARGDSARELAGRLLFDLQTVDPLDPHLG